MVIRTRLAALSPLVYLAVGMALLTSGSTWGMAPPLAGAWAGSEGWHALPLLVACAAIVFQRRHVMAGFILASAATVADAGLGLHVGVFLAWADTAYTLARRAEPHQRRWSIGLTGLAVVAFWAVVAALPHGADYALPVVLTLTAGVAIPFWWGAEVRNGDERAARADAAAHLERERSEAARRAAELERAEAVQRERAAMARELHDTVSAHLTSIALHAAAALSGPPAPEQDRGALQQTRLASLAALEDMREMIGLLQQPGQPLDLQVRGGAEPMAALIEQHRVAGQDLTAVLEAVQVTAAVGQALYRVVQEGLVNAGKHGGGPVSVRVRSAAGQVRLEIENPVPAGHRRGEGLGLPSMAERLRAVGGTLHIGHDDGRWRLSATVPGDGGPA